MDWAPERASLGRQVGPGTLRRSGLAFFRASPEMHSPPLMLPCWNLYELFWEGGRERGYRDPLDPLFDTPRKLRIRTRQGPCRTWGAPQGCSCDPTPGTERHRGRGAAAHVGFRAESGWERGGMLTTQGFMRPAE